MKAPETDALDAPGEIDGRLLGFYDRLRARVAGTTGKSGGGLRDSAAQALMLAPDVFILLVRLVLDREVPASSRRLIGGALFYFVLPIDLFPEAFTGPAGYLDDLVIACAVLGEAFGHELEHFTRRHWSGSARLGEVLGDVARTADSLLGADLAARVRRFLERRGVRIS